ncbi:DUF5996 family protein [Amycolatopsis sp. NPDC051372]|uniref:DUF5996 family protein n=2 Tax=unclassified Amycolatopsis TaxID=2618356 RepID=UPI00342C7AA1
MSSELAVADPWPALRVDDWTDTRDTLHMWTQVVGKIRMANTPPVNHWWQVPLYVSARGLTTSSIPNGNQLFDLEFDFVDHRLNIRVSNGAHGQVVLESKPVAVFYRETVAALANLGIEVSIWATPVEVERAIPFAEDNAHRTYEHDHARRFWGQLSAAHRVMSEYRAEFMGKSSPVHFFWGAMDLACTRFSGRAAPRHPGGVPNCPDRVMVEGYSHELASCGFWPGGSAEGSFYAYSYPEPAGYRQRRVTPNVAYFDAGLGEFLLPYEAVRTAPDPDGMLLGFLRSTYVAAADLGAWDREALEHRPHAIDG